MKNLLFKKSQTIFIENVETTINKSRQLIVKTVKICSNIRTKIEKIQEIKICANAIDTKNDRTNVN